MPEDIEKHTDFFYYLAHEMGGQRLLDAIKEKFFNDEKKVDHDQLMKSGKNKLQQNDKQIGDNEVEYHNARELLQKLLEPSPFEREILVKWGHKELVEKMIQEKVLGESPLEDILTYRKDEELARSIIRITTTEKELMTAVEAAIQAGRLESLKEASARLKELNPKWNPNVILPFIDRSVAPDILDFVFQNSKWEFSPEELLKWIETRERPVNLAVVKKLASKLPNLTTEQSFGILSEASGRNLIFLLDGFIQKEKLSDEHVLQLAGQKGRTVEDIKILKKVYPTILTEKVEETFLKEAQTAKNEADHVAMYLEILKNLPHV